MRARVYSTIATTRHDTKIQEKVKRENFVYSAPFLLPLLSHCRSNGLFCFSLRSAAVECDTDTGPAANTSREAEPLLACLPAQTEIFVPCIVR